MIRVGVKNFRGCRAAEIACDPVALVAGRNGAGKSSVAQAAAAALVGDPLVGGLTSKGGAGALVHDGATSGSAEIEDNAGRVRIHWPEASATAKGIAPQASAYAAGSASLAELAARARGAVLAEYLHAAPDRDDLNVALTAAGLGEAAIVEAVWQLVDERGWDDAHAIRRDKGAELKGRWRQVTGQTYGSRIGASWHPQDWSSDLDEDMTAAPSESIGRLAAEIERARAAYDAAIGRAAVSGAERERIAAEADCLDERKDRLRDAEGAAERAAAELDAAKEVRAQLGATPGVVPMACPHCGGMVEVRQVSLVESRLVAADAIDAGALKARRMAVADADGAVSRLTTEVAGADRTVERARAAMQQASEAKHRLADLPPPAPEAEIAAAKAALDRATARERASRQQAEADDLHGKIASNEALMKILAGDGLRAAKLGRVLDAFNRGPLAELTAAADWPAVEIRPDMTIAAAGRTYPLLSTSEQYRVRVVLQVAMAQIDGSSMVVIDAADLLDAPARSGLMALIDAASLPALVCMTASKPDQVPDLDRAGIGASYWIADGTSAALAGLGKAA